MCNKKVFSQFKSHLDFIYFKDKVEPYIDVFIHSDTSAKATISLVCSMVSEGHSKVEKKIFSKTVEVNLIQGINKIEVDLLTRKNGEINQSFFNVLKKFKIFPVADYNLELAITTLSSKTNFSFLRNIDSVIAVESPFSKQMQIGLNKIGKKNGKIPFDENSQNVKLDKLLSNKGLSRRTVAEGNQSFIYFFADGWFLGKFKMTKLGLAEDAKKVKETVVRKSDALVKHGLESYESIFSQTKKIERKDEQFAIGQIALSANIGNQQEAFSNEKKNFYEVQGNIEIPLFEIPISVEGFYTTQDIKRNIKASYIRLHYDVDKAKQKMMKLITGYKGQFEEVSAKGQGLDGNYRSYLQTLTGQKGNLFYQIVAQTGLKDYSSFVDYEALQRGEYIIDTTQLLNMLMKNSDSLASANTDEVALQKSNDSIRVAYSNILKKYNDLKALQQKYEKYKLLMDQYKNTVYFDSIVAYDKLKNLEDYENMSYKDLAKTASSVMPDGKVKKVITGITNLDVGIFSKYSSKYTLGGQQLKGMDVGYDMGFATSQLTAGKTEYIGRGGSIDRYTFYAGALKFKPIINQQFDLIYYGYNPSKRMFNENKEFFKNIDTEIPTFKNPVHIISIKHQGRISKFIHAETEVAISQKKTELQNENIPSLNSRMAYSIIVEGDIPKTNISANVAYEHTGRDFENNTLPFNLVGTDRIRIGSKTTLLNNYLQLGLEYNHLLQKNIVTTFTNSRWGFDIRTQSKRYPNIAISYKPFSTYRSYADTMAIPQRPMIGQVWTAKASYQFKKEGNIYKFMLMYNSAGNKMDSTQIKNEMFQFAFYFMNKRTLTNFSIHKLNFTSTAPLTVAPWHYQNSYMISVGESYSIQKNIQMSLGTDFAISKFGVSSLGGNAGISYRSAKTSVTYRLRARYMQYKLEEINAWQKVMRGSLDIIWQFKYKLNDLETTK